MAPADLLSSQIPPNNNLFEEVTANEDIKTSAGFGSPG